jgi:hypothetical protein
MTPSPSLRLVDEPSTAAIAQVDAMVMAICSNPPA